MAFIDVDDTDFQEVINKEFKKGQIVILKFGSAYCDACNALDFELEELEENHENITILEIECGESENLTNRYAINQVPTMVIYADANTTLWHKEGVLLASDIEKIIEL